MIDRLTFTSMVYRPEIEPQIKAIEIWLEDNLLPKMIEAVSKEKCDCELSVNTDEMDPALVRKLLLSKGYYVLWWPIAQQAGVLTKQVKFRVSW